MHACSNWTLVYLFIYFYFPLRFLDKNHKTCTWTLYTTGLANCLNPFCYCHWFSNENDLMILLLSQMADKQEKFQGSPPFGYNINRRWEMAREMDFWLPTVSSRPEVRRLDRRWTKRCWGFCQSLRSKGHSIESIPFHILLTKRGDLKLKCKL